MKVDCFIPCCVKDETKLLASIRSLAENLVECGDIYVSMPDCSRFQDFSVGDHKVSFHNDFDVLPIGELVARCRFRPSWIYQQLLKLFQSLTRTEYYFVFDADCVLLRKTSLFEDGKPKLFLQPNGSDEAAFHRFISRASGGELCTWKEGILTSTKYIADHGLFSREWVSQMVKRYFPTFGEFAAFTISNTYWKANDRERAVFISEYEMYGLFLERFHQDEVSLCSMTKKQIDKWQDWQEEEPQFTAEEVEEEIKKATEEGYSLLKLQTNCPRSPKVYAQKEEVQS